MKKIISIFILVFLSTSFCFSQDKGYVAISVGPSMPIGDYASTDLDNEKAGLAKTGAIFDFSFAYKLGKNMGLSAMLYGQSNPFDGKAIEDELANSGPFAYWTVESKSWSSGGLLFGGYGSFPIGKGNTSFDARAMIGFSNSTSPEFTITGSQSGQTFWIKTTSASATSFAYLVGGGFKFNVGPKVCLLVNLDYLNSKPEFQKVETTSSLGETGLDTYSQSISTINFGFGIGLRL